jgi:phospholipid/cholesterol/gamma-HCH transport system substrate-binding protein
MQKQAPSVGRILTMVLFALSCFGLLLFLWLSFGGPIPLKPSNYRFKVAVPEAVQLGLEADVRIAGVPVGKVRQKELAPDGNRTLITVEMERKYAPVSKKAKVILRQKTLLGETYVELTGGTPGQGDRLPEGGTLSPAQVEETVELDEIFQALDPQTRRAFHIWQQDLAASFRNRGQSFSDVLGNLPSFATNGADLLEILDEESTDVQRLVSGTGTVFEAITRDESALSGLIQNGARVFGATAAQNEALAETFRIFPTFLDESRVTLRRLQTFAITTNPLINELRPVARDLRPTLRSVRLFAPDLRNLFRDLEPLIRVSRTGLPALRDTLRGARPLLDRTGLVLQQLNPILELLEVYQYQVADFITNGSGALADTIHAQGGAPGHYLRQFGPTGPETFVTAADRIPVHRGNTYPTPIFVQGREIQQQAMFANWDCNHIGGPRERSREVPPGSPPAGSSRPQGTPACWVAPNISYQGQNQRFLHIAQANYSTRGR